MYLATHNVHCDWGTVLKFRHRILLAWSHLLVKFEDDVSNPSEVMISQTQKFGIRNSVIIM